MSDVKRTITPNDPADFTPTREPQIPLQPFRYWCQKVLPLVYDDSLSYYELLCKVVDYLNKTMEDVTNMDTDMTNLLNAYNQLQEYVNNYFSTLDVQEEINNKLNGMAEDGTLSELLSDIVGYDSYPTFVDSLSGMTNHKLAYVLTTNGHIYYYDNTWKDSGLVYGSFSSYTPSDILIAPTNVGSYFNDLNNAPLNKTVFLFNMTSDLMGNLPVNSVPYGALSTFQYSNVDNQPGGYQLLILENGAYVRLNTGSKEEGFSWAKWQNLNEKPNYRPSDILIAPTNVGSYFNDLNNAPLNKTVFLYNITSTLMSNLPVNSVPYGALSTFQYSSNGKQPGGYQLLILENGAYIRLNSGNEEEGFSWAEWQKLGETINYINGFNLFRSFCTIGDSLSVGYHTLKNGSPVTEDKDVSWSSYIKNKYNNTVYWSGKSGATCKSWLAEESETWGVKYMKKIAAQPLYILCMGANEVGSAIGSASDIGTDNDTLYAYVSKVISEVKKHSPNCFIISTGISRGQGVSGGVSAVNNVYKDMENHFENYFYLDCVVELNSEPFTSLYNDFHYTPLGYSALAELFERKINEKINGNIDDFLYAV